MYVATVLMCIPYWSDQSLSPSVGKGRQRPRALGIAKLGVKPLQVNEKIMEMLSKTKIAFSAVIALSAPFSASAATKPHVTYVHRPATHNVVPGYNPQTHLDSDDPALTGGGSLGYNRNIYNW
jgi:hypothetical protein